MPNILNKVQLEKAINELKTQLLQKDVLLEHQANELSTINEQYQTLYDFSSSMYLTLNVEMQITAINVQATKFFGGKKDNFFSKSFLDLVYSDYKNKCLKLLQTLLSKKKKQSFEFEIVRKKDRKLIQAEFIFINNLIHICFKDVTEIFHSNLQFNEMKKKLTSQIRNLSEYKIEESKQRKQQAEIAKASVTHAKVELAAALAHEISQPLTAITAYCQGALLKIKNGKLPEEMEYQLRFSLEKISLQAKLAGEIINSIKNQKGKEFISQELNINALIKETLALLHYETHDFDLKIEFDFMSNLPLISIDKIQIMQVILNLARNSIEAMQASMILNPYLYVKTEIEKDAINVHFRDNGPGIPQEFRNKILTTYFTSKPNGTGLGLAICRTLIETHGGELRLMDHRDQGAWFVFKLPIKRI